MHAVCLHSRLNSGDLFSRRISTHNCSCKLCTYNPCVCSGMWWSAAKVRSVLVRFVLLRLLPPVCARPRRFPPPLAARAFGLAAFFAVAGPRICSASSLPTSSSSLSDPSSSLSDPAMCRSRAVSRAQPRVPCDAWPRARLRSKYPNGRFFDFRFFFFFSKTRINGNHNT